MAVKIKSNAAPIPAQTDEDVFDMLLPGVEQAGLLQEEVAELEAKILRTANGKRLEFARKELATALSGLKEEILATDLAGDDTVAMASDHFDYEMSQAANSTEIVAKEKLCDYLKQLGPKEFLSLVNFKITELRTYLPGPFFKQITKTERKGNRKVKITRHTDDE